ncbi:hypothetical protein [Cobetia crustatorum]|nr:hypothetical protein [Cobetia crustatorum]
MLTLVLLVLLVLLLVLLVLPGSGPCDGGNLKTLILALLQC